MSTWAQTTVLVPERSFRGSGCDERCEVLTAFVAGRFGRSELLLHSAEAHELYGRRLAHGALHEHVVRTGGVAFDLDAASVTVDGRPIHLTGLELRLLYALAVHMGEVVEYRVLTGRVWGQAALETSALLYRHMLRVNVARLRQRLLPWQPLLVTVPMIGYRLDAVPPGTPKPQPPSVPPLRDRTRWALEYDACLACGLTDIPHAGHGYCGSCIGHRAVRPNRGRMTTIMSRMTTPLERFL